MLTPRRFEKTPPAPDAWAAAAADAARRFDREDYAVSPIEARMRIAEAVADLRQLR